MTMNSRRTLFIVIQCLVDQFLCQFSRRFLRECETEEVVKNYCKVDDIRSKILRCQWATKNRVITRPAISMQFPTYTFSYSPYSNLATAIPNPAPGNSSAKMGLMSFAKDKRSEGAIAGAGEVPLKDICCRLQVAHLKPTGLTD